MPTTLVAAAEVIPQADHALAALRDPVWQAVGVLVSLSLPALGWLLSARKGALAYEMESSLMVTVKKPLTGQLEVRFAGVIVREPRLVRLKLANVGHTAIRTTDFESPVAIRFPSGTVVLTAEAISVNPPDLDSTVSTSDNTVLIPPRLLNPGDWIELHIFADGPTHPLSIACRIAGVTAIQRDSGLSFKRRDFIYFGIFDLTIVVLGVQVAFRTDHLPFYLLASVLIVGGTLLVFDYLRQLTRYMRHGWLRNP